jgi:hypothetical protein
VHGGAREVAFAEQLVELSAAQGRSHEDDDLVELERIEEVIQLAVLLALIELDVVLLKTVEGQLLLIIHIDLERVLHEFLADHADILGKCGRKHHDLLVRWGGPEDGLNVIAHVYKFGLDGTPVRIQSLLTGLVKHLVALVEHEVLQARKTELLVADKGVDATWCANNDVGVGVLVGQKLDILLDRGSSVEDANLHIGKEFGETSILILDLVGQLARVTHD